MMDSKMIASIVKLIKQSDMSDLNLISVEERPITVEIDEQGRETHKTYLSLSDCIGRSRAELSEAWVAGNLMLFTVYDGYLENKYRLTEGASFRNHYDNLPQSSNIEIIEKDCYRILKLIRNAIQHNLSSVEFNNGAYSVTYTFKNINFNLQISCRAMRFLYSLVLSLINDNIDGICKKHRTDGHYEGIINSMYAEVRAGIEQLTDDITGNLIGKFHALRCYDDKHLRMCVRYPVENPTIVSETENAVVFKHIENNGTDDENDVGYHYSIDYVYKDYLLPQELGCITRKESGDLQERLSGGVIKFLIADINDSWKMKE